MTSAILNSDPLRRLGGSSPLVVVSIHLDVGGRGDDAILDFGQNSPFDPKKKFRRAKPWQGVSVNQLTS